MSTLVHRPALGSAVLALAIVALAGLLAAATSASAAAHRWVPHRTASFQYQLSGVIDTTVAAAVFDIDAFETTRQTVDRLHARGRHVICYVDAGSWESYRPDVDRFPEAILGKPSAIRKHPSLGVWRRACPS